MRTLQVNEKLYAANERFPEAQHVRCELVKLEASEQNRVINEVIQGQDKLISKMKAKHRNEIRQAQQRNQTEYNKLTIQMERQNSALQKEIKHYSNDIKKSQNIAERLAKNAGS